MTAMVTSALFSLWKSNISSYAMLLAGGQGSRLGVLTSKMAKPAVAFGGKYRIIDFPLSAQCPSVPILYPFVRCGAHGIRSWHNVLLCQYYTLP
mgnify:CR=1 FL=1